AHFRVLVRGRTRLAPTAWFRLVGRETGPGLTKTAANGPGAIARRRLRSGRLDLAYAPPSPAPEGAASPTSLSVFRRAAIASGLGRRLRAGRRRRRSASMSPSRSEERRVGKEVR